MIPLESPVPEIGPPGSESGERKRAHGNRPAARLRKHRMSHRSPTGDAPPLDSTPVLLARHLGAPTPNCRGFRNGMRSVIRDGSSPRMRASGPPPCWSALVTPNENRKLRASATSCAARNRGAESGAVSDGCPRQRSGAPASHWQPVDQGPAFRLARKGLPHGRSRQSSEGPQRSGGPAQRVDGRDRPCVVNALRAKRGPYPGAPRTGLNPPTPLSGEPQEP